MADVKRATGKKSRTKSDELDWLLDLIKDHVARKTKFNSPFILISTDCMDEVLEWLPDKPAQSSSSEHEKSEYRSIPETGVILHVRHPAHNVSLRRANSFSLVSQPSYFAYKNSYEEFDPTFMSKSFEQFLCEKYHLTRRFGHYTYDKKPQLDLNDFAVVTIFYS